jgi:AraC-like DNA-binding protein
MLTMARYTPVRNAMFDYRCYQQGEEAVVEFQPRLRLDDFEKFMGYTTVLTIYSIFKVISEEAMSDATRLTFPWKASSWPPDPPMPVVACDFDQPFLGIRVPLEMAMRPSQSAEPDLCERLKMAGEDELTKSMGSTAAKVRHLLHHKTTEWPSLQEVADMLAMSKRTVIRKLESEELSYQVLLDEARCELACWFLRRPDIRLSEIAEQVGFSDQASFTRSFRRVQGCSPSQYRSDLRRALDMA